MMNYENSGRSGEEGERPQRSEKEVVEQLLAEAQVLDGIRAPWEAKWQRLADVVNPSQGQISRRNSTQGPDTDRVAENFDGTAMRSNRTLAQGQASRITPMGARWFVLRPPEDLAEDAAALDWYLRCSERLTRKLYDSNFYNRAFQHYLDRGAFGVAATEIVGGKHGRGLHFRSYPVGSYSIANNDNDEVDTLSRTFRWTPAQIVSAFPRERIPASILKMHDDPAQRQQLLELRHHICPRHDRDPRKLDALNKAYASYIVYAPEKVVLSESGYDSFPVAVSRWELSVDSPYGWSPAMLALPEANQANHLEEMLDVQAETAAFPRVLYTGALKGDIDFAASGLTCWDPTQGEGAMPREWLTGGRYDVGKDRAGDKRKAIEEAFFVPLFNSISNLRGDTTATEVRALVTESRELFHPIFANLTREFLGPILRRSFALLLQQGEMPPPPPAVVKQTGAGRVIDEPNVEYTSAMALALEQSQLANLTDCFNVLRPLASIDPTALDFVNVQVLGPAIFRAKGLPANWTRSEEEMAALQQARAQQQQMAMIPQAAKAVKDVGGIEKVQQMMGQQQG
ncbi:MAG: bacteriophage head to tail connecting protein [Akkermansiaceae bacterium]|nr:bacteriophage head to tail connecting protein [Akkermansiaceae bacterium]